MNKKIRAARDQDKSTQDGTEQSARRMRILMFACRTDDARQFMTHLDQVEMAYLPSFDMEEISEEIERFSPNLVLCGANVFRTGRFASRFDHSLLIKEDKAGANAELLAPTIAPREMKVLTMLTKGHKNDEMAEALRVSSRTVKRILTDLFERFAVNNRTELASRAAELSLVDRND